MKINAFSNIRARLTTWFLIIIFVPLTFVLLLTYFQRVASIKERTIDKLVAIRDLKVERLNDWLDERDGDMAIMSRDDIMRNLELVTNNDKQDDAQILASVTEHLQRYVQYYMAYNEVYVVHPTTATILVSTNVELSGKDMSNHPFYNEVIESKEPYVSDIQHSKLTQKISMAYASPIFSMSNEDQIVGVLVAMIDLDESLFKMLSDRVGLGETGETLIVNEHVVALNQLRWHENAPLNLQISAQPALLAAHGNTGIAITADYRKEEVLAAYTHIDRMGWGFVCKQDMYELNKPIRDMMWSFTLVFLLVGMVISALALRLSRTLSKPILEMDQVARKMSAGDFSIRNKIKSDDELGSLAREFNNMAEVVDETLYINRSIAKISEAMINPTSMAEFGDTLLKRLMEITKADKSTFFILNEVTMSFEHFTSIAVPAENLQSYPANTWNNNNVKDHASGLGDALQALPEQSIIHYQSSQFGDHSHDVISIPLFVDGTLIARISLIKAEPFSRQTMRILQQSLTNMHTAYSNLLSNERTRILAEHLSKTNQQLEAQSEELQDLTEELQDQAEELMRTGDELHEQNVELETQKQQVEVANKLKTEFLSNMSHELRTPLNSVMALSRVLIMQANSKLSEEENNYLEIIERNGKRLLALINDILDLSKIEAGKMEVLTHHISLESTIYMLKDNMQSLADEKGVSLNVSIPEGLPQLETDEERLFQVLLNIVSNAVKFTEKGSVDIAIRRGSDELVVDVKDSGIGIAAEMLPYVFDEFRQADGTSARQFEGTGLGLAIAKKMITILGGSISVQSELGKGSTFSIHIPIKWHNGQRLSPQKANGPKMMRHEQTNRDITTVHDDLYEDISGKRLLIIEDNKDAITQLKSVFEMDGFLVDVAMGGLEALHFMKIDKPDAIILDLMMPDIDGFEVLEQLRSKPATKNIPVLILTAKDLNHNDLARLSANNIHQVIQKGDVDVSGLLAKVYVMLGIDTADFKHKEKSSGRPKKIQKEEFIAAKDMDVKNAGEILVIENNHDNLTTIKAILKDRFEIMEAYDGNTGLKIIYQMHPKLILLDMSLPQLDGESIVKILKSDVETRHIPVIAVTAQAMKGDRERFLNAGCDGYVSKPIDRNLLLQEIDRLLT